MQPLHKMFSKETMLHNMLPILHFHIRNLFQVAYSRVQTPQQYAICMQTIVTCPSISFNDQAIFKYSMVIHEIQGVLLPWGN